MKKRILACVLTMAMTCGLLAGCGSSSDSDSSDSSSSAAASESSSDESYNICVIVKHTDGHFLKVMAGAQAYADENDNVTVDFQSPTSSSDYDGQMNMIETALNSGAYDALVIAPLQSETTATAVADTDLVVVALDTDFTSDKKATFVGTGNEEAAYNGGLATVQKAIDNGVESPTVAILTGAQGDETHEDRMAGYKAAVEELGGEVIEVQYCDAVADKAADTMESLIQKYADGIDIVLCTSDDMALGAMKVVQDSGSAAYENTLICGLDGNQSAIEAIQDGTLAMDIAQNGYNMGYKAVEAAVLALQGQSVESFIDSGSQVISLDNAEDYIAQMKEIGAWEE